MAPDRQAIRDALDDGRYGTGEAAKVIRELLDECDELVLDATHAEEIAREKITRRRD